MPIPPVNHQQTASGASAAEAEGGPGARGKEPRPSLGTPRLRLAPPRLCSHSLGVPRSRGRHLSRSCLRGPRLPWGWAGQRALEDRLEQSAAARKPKSRTKFSPEQLRGLRTIFAGSRYLTPEKGHQLAALLGLSYKQVKAWFQNQRLQAKRAEMEAAQPQVSSPPRGLLQDCPFGQLCLLVAPGLSLLPPPPPPPQDGPGSSSGLSSLPSQLPLAAAWEATLGRPGWSSPVRPWAPPALPSPTSLLDTWAQRAQSSDGPGTPQSWAPPEMPFVLEDRKARSKAGEGALAMGGCHLGLSSPPSSLSSLKPPRELPALGPRY
ncbi:homeobox protein VENTX-like isoform X2 [Monodelphis domestica]|uniref:homeobox protein VENTX-like isoform X2 n=1 Tax=Monodelphis domestica TaxID=13616 RepID=UPI0024E1A81E|nr:homeobox protein VENTX-like isoform X2 [Monodelphis domestica]